jgi:hypothetical protein
MEALEARLHLSGSPAAKSDASPEFMTFFQYSLLDKSTNEWGAFKDDHEITIPETQVIDLDGDIRAAPSEHLHKRFTMTRDDGTTVLTNEYDEDENPRNDRTFLFYGPLPDDGTWLFKYEITQQDGAVAQATFTVHVVNSAPIVHAMDGEPWDTARAGEKKTISVLPWDSWYDVDAALKYHFDWDGDGYFEQTVQRVPFSSGSLEGMRFGHTYQWGGDYTIGVYAEDKDGGIGETSYLTLHVDGPPRPVDPQPSPSPEPEPQPAPEVQHFAIVPTVTTKPFQATMTVQDDSLFADTTPILA